jgi:hypothetical protein
MGQQMPLPARWAQSLFSSSYPEDRLNELVNDRREMFGDVRAAIDKFAGSITSNSGTSKQRWTRWTTRLVIFSTSTKRI